MENTPANSNNHPKTISYTRVVDLSHAIHPDIPQWPGDPPVDFEIVAGLNQDNYFLRRFTMGEHSATHLNAPVSFHARGNTVDAYPAASLVAPAVVFDAEALCSRNPDYAWREEDARRWESIHGPVPANTIALLRTNWDRKWADPKQYLGIDQGGALHFPGFGLDAARFLLEERHIGGIGIDTHGVDPGNDVRFLVNRLLLEQPRIVLENLTNLDQLPPKGATLVIGILRLQGGSGSPVSALALVP